jgi:hypothetical protein
MSMVAPLGVLLASSSVATTKVGEDIDGIIWPLGGGGVRSHHVPKHVLVPVSDITDSSNYSCGIPISSSWLCSN